MQQREFICVEHADRPVALMSQHLLQQSVCPTFPAAVAVTTVAFYDDVRICGVVSLQDIIKAFCNHLHRLFLDALLSQTRMSQIMPIRLRRDSHVLLYHNFTVQLLGSRS